MFNACTKKLSIKMFTSNNYERIVTVYVPTSPSYQVESKSYIEPFGRQSPSPPLTSTESYYSSSSSSPSLQPSRREPPSAAAAALCAEPLPLLKVAKSCGVKRALGLPMVKPKPKMTPKLKCALAKKQEKEDNNDDSVVESRRMNPTLFKPKK